MPKEKEFLFGDIIIEKTNLENANKIRSEILHNFPRKWVYVIKTGSAANYKVGIANQLGFKMSAVELQAVKRFLKDFSLI